MNTSDRKETAMKTQYVEEAEYKVQVVLTNVISFSPISRPTPLSRQDAIENGLGTMPDEVWTALEAEGWTIETTAERLD
jgi:hypothetical protein